MNAPSPTEHAERLALLGKLTWLWMNSPLHVDWTMQLAMRFLLPAIEYGQLHILEREGLPVAYCSWAWLSADAELAYLADPSKVVAHDWHSGDRLWFIDWVAPFGVTDNWHLRRAMMQKFPQGVARAIRVKRDRNKARVMEFKGPGLDSGVAQERLKRYYDHFLCRAQRKTNALRINVPVTHPAAHAADASLANSGKLMEENASSIET